MSNLPDPWVPTAEGLRNEIIEKYGCRDEAQYAWLTCLLNDTYRSIFQAGHAAQREVDPGVLAALKDAIYEVTHLTTCMNDGKYRPIIKSEVVERWRDAIRQAGRGSRNNPIVGRNDR